MFIILLWLSSFTIILITFAVSGLLFFIFLLCKAYFYVIIFLYDIYLVWIKLTLLLTLLLFIIVFIVFIYNYFHYFYVYTIIFIIC